MSLKLITLIGWTLLIALGCNGERAIPSQITPESASALTPIQTPTPTTAPTPASVPEQATINSSKPTAAPALSLVSTKVANPTSTPEPKPTNTSTPASSTGPTRAVPPTQLAKATPTHTPVALTASPSPSPTPTLTPTQGKLPLDTAVVSELQAVTVTGLMATVPSYASIDASEVAELIELVYPGRVPNSIQILVMLSEDDQAYVVIALDTAIDRFITAGNANGIRLHLPEGLPEELDFAEHLIISDSITPMEPLKVTPSQVIQAPNKYAFKRVVMDTTYLFSGVRIKDAPPSLDHMGFGFATDNLGSQSGDDYLMIVDPYNTETQIRTADVTGTVLFPTEKMRLMLSQMYRFAPDDVEEILDRPSVFYENLVDDEAQLLSIGDLVPTLDDPTQKLHSFHGEMVSVEGIALGGVIRTEDIPIIKNLPAHVTVKFIGVADKTGVMPIIGISSEDASGEIFGFFRFDLSVHSFDDGQAFAFLIGKEAVPLDPVAEIQNARLGNRVKTSLSEYVVTEVDRIELSEGLILEEFELLLPLNDGDPIIMTRHPDLSSGDFLSDVDVDGFLLDERMLGLPEDLIGDYGSGVIVVDASELSYERAVPPALTPIPLATSVPLSVPTAAFP